MITETLTGEEGALGSGGITFATLTGLSTLEDRGSEEDRGKGGFSTTVSDVETHLAPLEVVWTSSSRSPGTYLSLKNMSSSSVRERMFVRCAWCTRPSIARW